MDKRILAKEIEKILAEEEHFKMGPYVRKFEEIRAKIFTKQWKYLKVRVEPNLDEAKEIPEIEIRITPYEGPICRSLKELDEYLKVLDGESKEIKDKLKKFIDALKKEYKNVVLK